MATAATLAERDARYERLRAEMAKRGFDALLIGGKGHAWTGRGYIRYLTDFHLWAHDALLVFPAEGEPAIAVTSYAVAGLVAERRWISDTGGDAFLVPRTLRSLVERGLHRGRIGTVGTPWIVSAGLERALVDGLSSAEIMPADDLLDTVRMAKSELEVAQNRELWGLAVSSMERFAEVARLGASQLELSAEACRVALAGGARDLLALVGEGSGGMAPPADVPVRCDDLLRYHMEICGPSGHWCELTVTLAYRSQTEAELSLNETELTVRDLVRAAARPGVPLSELARIFESAILADGWSLGPPSQHFDFHGQGMDAIERPWYADEQPWGSAGDAELVEGAVVSYHPSRRIEERVGWAAGVSDNFLVAADGGEWLSGSWKHEWREMAA